MTTKNQTIQCISPLDLSLTSYDGKNFHKLTKPLKCYTVSRVLFEDVITYSFKIPFTQSTEDLASMVEIKMYEEAGLNLEKNYKITHIIKQLEFEEMALIEVFAVDFTKIYDNFKTIIKQVKYIDFLAIPFLAFSALYKNKILETKNDIFFYLGETEAFISFYKDGNYISSKSMINFKKIVKRINESGILIDSDRLYGILKEKGLYPSNYTEEEKNLFDTLEKIFSEILSTINSVAMHNRNVFGFDKIQRLFFTTKEAEILGFKAFVANFGLINVEVLDFNFFTQKQERNSLNNVISYYCFDKYLEDSNEQNITIFVRPPIFYKSEIGRFIYGMIGVLLSMSFSYFYYYLEVSNATEQQVILQKKYNELQKKENIYKTALTITQDEISKITMKIQEEQKSIQKIVVAMDEMEQKQNSENNFVNFLAQINSMLQEYNLRVVRIEQRGFKYLEVEVFTNYNTRDNISKFIKALIAEGFVDVQTNEIKLDNTNYISKICLNHE